jgi:hypothetical protein
MMPTDESLHAVEQLPAELQRALRPKPETLAERILQRALDQAHLGNRNDKGFWLACQLRDNGVPKDEAKAVVLDYAARVNRAGAESYAEAEAIASLEQAYSQPAREPWILARRPERQGSRNLLLDSRPLVVIPELAVAVGLNEAIVLQQLHYWTVQNHKAGRNYRDGHWWVYNSYPKWKTQLPFWSIATIRRIFQTLRGRGYLVVANFNRDPKDRTLWYRIDYERLEAQTHLRK